MGLVDEVRGQRICIDTAPFIYFIEGHTRYHVILRPLFVEIDSGNIEAITSTITLLEVLTPMNAHQIKITAKEIQDLLPTLSGSEILELDRKIHEYLETMAYSKAAETAFSEWNDPEEGIYDET